MSKNNLIAFEPANLPAEYRAKFGADAADDLIASGPGFPVLSIRASKWRVKVAGEEMPLINAETDEPMPSIEVVIIKAAKGLTKNYYAESYTEGDAEQPDCFSNDGERPDPQAQSPQCDNCAVCPHNMWGSRISDSGSKAKKCSDSKTLAVTFTNDMDNETLGGPMLLRIPPASLKDLSTFARAMKAKGFMPQQISIRIGFDIDASYPKLTFKAVRPLKPAEIHKIAELFDTEQVASIMHEQAPVVAPKPAARPVAKPAAKTVDTDFEVDTETGEITPATAPKAKAAATAPKAKAAPKVKAQQMDIEDAVYTESPAKSSPGANAGAADADIDDIIADLDGL